MSKSIYIVSVKSTPVTDLAVPIEKIGQIYMDLSMEEINKQNNENAYHS